MLTMATDYLRLNLFFTKKKKGTINSKVLIMMNYSDIITLVSVLPLIFRICTHIFLELIFQNKSQK